VSKIKLYKHTPRWPVLLKCSKRDKNIRLYFSFKWWKEEGVNEISAQGPIIRGWSKNNYFWLIYLSTNQSFDKNNINIIIMNSLWKKFGKNSKKYYIIVISDIPTYNINVSYKSSLCSMFFVCVWEICIEWSI